MQDATPKQDSSKNSLLLRTLGGFDRSRPSDKSDNSFYDLLNLRPIRGSLEQTDLVGTLIPEIVES